MNEYSRSAFLQHADFDKDAYNKRYYQKNKQWKRNYNHDYYLKNKDKWGLGQRTLSKQAVKRTDEKGTISRPVKKGIVEKVGDVLITITPGIGRLYNGSSREFVNSVRRSVSSIANAAKKAKEWWDSSNINPQVMFDKVNEIQSKIDKLDKDIQARKDAFSKKLSHIRKILGI